MAKRVNHLVEPTLKPMHRYIVALYVKLNGVKFRYCANRQEVRELKKKQKPGTYLEVFEAKHRFKEAWLA